MESKTMEIKLEDILLKQLKTFSDLRYSSLEKSITDILKFHMIIQNNISTKDSDDIDKILLNAASDQEEVIIQKLKFNSDMTKESVVKRALKINEQFSRMNTEDQQIVVDLLKKYEN